MADRNHRRTSDNSSRTVLIQFIGKLFPFRRSFYFLGGEIKTPKITLAHVMGAGMCFRFVSFVSNGDWLVFCVQGTYKCFNCLQFQDKPLIGVACECDETYFYFCFMSHAKLCAKRFMHSFVGHPGSAMAKPCLRVKIYLWSAHDVLYIYVL